MAHFNTANNQEVEPMCGSCSSCYFMELQHVTQVITWCLKYLTHPPHFLLPREHAFFSFCRFLLCSLASGHLFPVYTQSVGKNSEYNTHMWMPPLPNIYLYPKPLSRLLYSTVYVTTSSQV